MQTKIPLFRALHLPVCHPERANASRGICAPKESEERRAQKEKSLAYARDFSFWQRMRDSNPRERSQSPVCYRYTNPLCCEQQSYYTQFFQKVNTFFRIRAKIRGGKLPLADKTQTFGCSTVKLCAPTWTTSVSIFAPFISKMTVYAPSSTSVHGAVSGLIIRR